MLEINCVPENKENGNLKKGALAIIIDGENQLLMLQTAFRYSWKLVRCDIPEGADFNTALLEGLARKLGTDKFTLLSKANNLVEYRWPKSYEKTSESPYSGRSLVPCLIRFDGNKDEIKPDLWMFQKADWADFAVFRARLIGQGHWQSMELPMRELLSST